MRRYVSYVSREGKGWINLPEGKSVLLAAKCSANGHSSPFSTADSGIRVDLSDGTRCALQFRALVRSMRDRYGTLAVAYRVLVKYLRCIPTRWQKAGGEGGGREMREKEKLSEGRRGVEGILLHDLGI